MPVLAAHPRGPHYVCLYVFSLPDWFQVEYCTAERPTASLRGSTEQYVRVLEDLKERCRRDFWEYNIRVLGNCKFEGWSSAREVETRPLKPRIGACDIIISWQHMSNIHHLPIHSKVQSRRWPNIESICNELLQALPVKYHDIRFLLQNTSHGPIPEGARLDLKVLQVLFAHMHPSPDNSLFESQIMNWVSLFPLFARFIE